MSLCVALPTQRNLSSRRRAKSASISPDNDRSGANVHLTLALPTGLGQARNAVIVTAADSVIAIGAGWGTLSEIAIARRLGRSVFALDTWDVRGLEVVDTPAEAVKRALED